MPLAQGAERGQSTTEGGELVVGSNVRVGTSALSVHEVRAVENGEFEIATLAALELEAATATPEVNSCAGFEGE